MPHARSRSISRKLAKLARLWPAVGVTGARQAGKTTLLRDQLGIASYVSLDDEDARGEAEASAKLFLAKRERPIILDEIQKVPKLFDACKALIDKKRVPGQFYLTGSTEFSAKVGVRESLTGRIGLLHLFPLTLSEALEKPFLARAKLIHGGTVRFGPEDLAAGCVFGGMPVPMFLRDGNQRKLYWEGWLETTLYRDLFSVYGRGYRPEIALRIMRETGKALSDGEWPALKHFSLESRKLRKYLEAMETVFLLRRLPAHPRSIGGDVWMPLDSGLSHYLMGTDQGEGPALSLIRQCVINEILANFEYGAGRLALSFYRSAKGSPVDFVCEKEGIALKIVIQSREGGWGWQERSLAGAMKTLGLARGFLVTSVAQPEVPGKGIGVLPWSYWS